MAKEYPFYIAGEWHTTAEKLEVLSPYRGELVGVTSYANEEDLERAIVAAVSAFETTRHLAAYERAEFLSRMRDGLVQRQEELARLITLESGKTISESRREVERAVFTLGVAAEEAKRFTGEVIPLDLMAASKGRIGIIQRFPIGPIVAITPFNFPLNLALHKIAPAIAVGNPVIIKPPLKTPLTMLLMTEIIDQADLPAGAFSIMNLDYELAGRLVADERTKMLSFTGSVPVGWALKQKATRKKVTLELGGNAGVIVDKGANLTSAATRITAGSFAQAGQSCISVQRVYVHQDIFEDFKNALLKEVAKIRMGDPLDPETTLGPMIDPGAVKRTADWVNEAVAEGAQVLSGGKARGAFFEPTVLINVAEHSKVCTQEVFAPVVSLFSFADFKDAVARVNASAFGLQAGVFTTSLENAFYAYQEIEAGGIIINDIPSYRIDHMPYGGVKDSGMGREGLKYAMEEMTEPRLLVLSTA